MAHTPEFQPLYRTVSSIRVPGFVIDRINDDPVTAQQTPFREGFIPDFSRIVTSNRRTKSVPQFVQISPTQKRSFEIRYGREAFIFWADEYRNPYGVLQEKGGSVITPDVRVEKRAPSGFIIWGIQDSDSILRTIRASNLLRSQHIDTEAIVRLIEPSQLQWKGESISIDEYKRRLIQKVWKENYRKDTHNKDGWNAVTRSDVPKLTIELENMTFYLSTLGRQVSERFHDLKYVSSTEKLKEVMKRVFTFWNAKNKWLENQGKESFPHDLNSENQDDILKYFTTYLPTVLANNYAALHNLGLVHTFPHLGNVSLVGSIYDLDSVYGEPLGIGDEKVTERDIMDDVECLIEGKKGWQQADGIMHLLSALGEQGIFPEGSKVSELFTRSFIMQYVKNRHWGDEITPNLRNIDYLLNLAEIDPDSEDEITQSYLLDTFGEKGVTALKNQRIQSDLVKRYRLPLVVDPENILQLPEDQEVPDQITTNEPMSDERKKEVFRLTYKLLLQHQYHLFAFPNSGKDYFNFPKVHEDILNAHKILSNQDVADILHLWVNGGIEERFLHRIPLRPRTFGSFLLAFSQINTIQVAKNLEAVAPQREDSEFALKFSRLNDLFELLPPGAPIEDFRKYVYGIFDKSEAFSIEREAEVRSGLRLFGYGIITDNFSNEVFNQRDLDILLNEFKREHLPALQAALDCPELMDPINRFSPEDALHHVRLALTGVQVRDGQVKDLALLGDRTEKNTQRESAYLQYFFASVDKDTVEDDVLKDALIPIDKDWVVGMVRHLLIAGRDIHPNSYFATSLRETKLEAKDVVEILKISLDMLNGDLSILSPTIKSVIERPAEGLVPKDKASGLVMACVAYGIDLPDIIQSYLTKRSNQLAFMDFLSSDRIIKESGIYEPFASYPVNPIYRLMSLGVEAIPDKIKALFEQDGDKKATVNILADRILNSLLTEDYGYDSYFRCFFGGMLGARGYPVEQRLTREDYGATKSNGKLRWQLWRIVHPDIWYIIASADTKLLARYVKTKLPKGTVKMELGLRGEMFSHIESDLSECLPPYLYERISAPLRIR